MSAEEVEVEIESTASYFDKYNTSAEEVAVAEERVSEAEESVAKVASFEIPEYVMTYMLYVFETEYPNVPRYVDLELFKTDFCNDFYKNMLDDFFWFTVIPFCASTFDPGAGLTGDYVADVVYKYPMPPLVQLHFKPDYKPTPDEYDLNFQYFDFYLHKDETEEEVDNFIRKLKGLSPVKYSESDNDDEE